MRRWLLRNERIGRGFGQEQAAGQSNIMIIIGRCTTPLHEPFAVQKPTLVPLISPVPILSPRSNTR